MNGHGGDASLLDVACRDTHQKYGLMTFVVHLSVPSDDDGAGHSAEHGMGARLRKFQGSYISSSLPRLTLSHLNRKLRSEMQERSLPLEKSLPGSLVSGIGSHRSRA